MQDTTREDSVIIIKLIDNLNEEVKSNNNSVISNNKDTIDCFTTISNKINNNNNNYDTELKNLLEKCDWKVETNSFKDNTTITINTVLLLLSNYIKYTLNRLIKVKAKTSYNSFISDVVLDILVNNDNSIDVEKYSNSEKSNNYILNEHDVVCMVVHVHGLDWQCRQHIVKGEKGLIDVLTILCEYMGTVVTTIYNSGGDVVHWSQQESGSTLYCAFNKDTNKSNIEMTNLEEDDTDNNSPVNKDKVLPNYINALQCAVQLRDLSNTLPNMNKNRVNIDNNALNIQVGISFGPLKLALLGNNNTKNKNSASGDNDGDTKVSKGLNNPYIAAVQGPFLPVPPMFPSHAVAMAITSKIVTNYETSSPTVSNANTRGDSYDDMDSVSQKELTEFQNVDADDCGYSDMVSKGIRYSDSHIVIEEQCYKLLHSYTDGYPAEAISYSNSNYILQAVATSSATSTAVSADNITAASAMYDRYASEPVSTAVQQLLTSLPSSPTNTTSNSEHNSNNNENNMSAKFCTGISKNAVLATAGIVTNRDEVVVIPELKNVSYLFIRLEIDNNSNSDEERNKEVSSLFDLQECVQVMQEVVSEHGGLLLPLTVFCTNNGNNISHIEASAVWGCPQFSHPQKQLACLASAVTLRSKLSQFDLSCRFGIATGQCYCGMIGSSIRREYAVIGNAASFAARLGRKANNDTNILLDNATFMRLPFSILHVLRKLPKQEIHEGVSIYSYESNLLLELDKMKINDYYEVRPTIKKTLLSNLKDITSKKNNKHKNNINDLPLNYFDKKHINSTSGSNAYETPLRFILIEGKYGAGKKTTFDWFRQQALNNGVKPFNIRLTAGDGLCEYNLIRSMFRYLVKPEMMDNLVRQKIIVLHILRDICVDKTGNYAATVALPAMRIALGVSCEIDAVKDLNYRIDSKTSSKKKSKSSASDGIDMSMSMGDAEMSVYGGGSNGAQSSGGIHTWQILDTIKDVFSYLLRTNPIIFIIANLHFADERSLKALLHLQNVNSRSIIIVSAGSPMEGYKYQLFSRSLYLMKPEDKVSTEQVPTLLDIRKYLTWFSDMRPLFLANPYLVLLQLEDYNKEEIIAKIQHSIEIYNTTNNNNSNSKVPKMKEYTMETLANAVNAITGGYPLWVQECLSFIESTGADLFIYRMISNHTMRERRLQMEQTLSMRDSDTKKKFRQQEVAATVSATALAEEIAKELGSTDYMSNTPSNGHYSNNNSQSHEKASSDGVFITSEEAVLDVEPIKQSSKNVVLPTDNNNLEEEVNTEEELLLLIKTLKFFHEGLFSEVCCKILLLNRLSLLSEFDRDVLRCATLIGFDFNPKALTRLVPYYYTHVKKADEDVVVDALAAAVSETTGNHSFAIIANKNKNEADEKVTKSIMLEQNADKIALVPGKKSTTVIHQSLSRLVSSNWLLDVMQQCDRYQFAHPFVYQTLYSSFTERELQKLHRAMAAYIEARHEKESQYFAELSMHFSNFSPDQAIEYAIRYIIYCASPASSHILLDGAVQMIYEMRRYCGSATEIVLLHKAIKLVRESLKRTVRQQVSTAVAAEDMRVHRRSSFISRFFFSGKHKPVASSKVQPVTIDSSQKQQSQNRRRSMDTNEFQVSVQHSVNITSGKHSSKKRANDNNDNETAVFTYKAINYFNTILDEVDTRLCSMEANFSRRGIKTHVKSWQKYLLEDLDQSLIELEEALSVKMRDWEATSTKVSESRKAASALTASTKDTMSKSNKAKKLTF